MAITQQCFDEYYYYCLHIGWEGNPIVRCTRRISNASQAAYLSTALSMLVALCPVLTILQLGPFLSRPCYYWCIHQMCCVDLQICAVVVYSENYMTLSWPSTKLPDFICIYIAQHNIVLSIFRVYVLTTKCCF